MISIEDFANMGFSIYPIGPLKIMLLLDSIIDRKWAHVFGPISNIISSVLSISAVRAESAEILVANLKSNGSMILSECGELRRFWQCLISFSS